MQKPFDQWNKGDLQEEFDLQREKQCKALDAWLARPDEVPIELNEHEQISLNLLREEWNECELREQFSGPIVKLARFNDAKRLILRLRHNPPWRWLFEDRKGLKTS